MPRGAGLCGSVRGAHGARASRLGHAVPCRAMPCHAMPCHAIWTVPCQGRTEPSQGCHPSTSRGGGLAVGGLPDGRRHHRLLCWGEGGSSRTRAPQTWGGWGKECRAGGGPTAPCTVRATGKSWGRRGPAARLVPPLPVSPVLGDVCGAGPVSLRGDGLHVHPAGHTLWGAGLEVTCPGRGPPPAWHPRHGPGSPLPVGAAPAHPGSAAIRGEDGVPSVPPAVWEQSSAPSQADLGEAAEEEAEAGV